ncbi:MAG: 16S rRNA (cytidine(1402)-2'-O)-methyltransferase [Candidatus Doudnabacteria bacterium]|nr:16S rRNA (cytidine(1402)-2'-O)-methyltransferase [Candidatus Doudnabacteria bacterium]
MLYIVATPIGNMGDITLRAIETLKRCDFVIAENPGYSRRLLQYIDGLSVRTASVIASNDSVGMTAKKEVVQFAEHNEQQIVKELARRLSKQDGALITDAGTPGISDPGFRLVRECVKENVQVIPFPGPNAAIAALSASGLPTDKFLFLGFLQKTVSKTVEALQFAANAEATAIFYESPERILKTLSYISNAFPSSQVVIARELTKMHEEFIRGTPTQVSDALKDKPSIKGEFTVMISFK